MEKELDYFDIQGNILLNYNEFGFLKARYVFIEITNGGEGRKFIENILPYITNSNLKSLYTAKATTNIAFTYNGLKHLGLPVLTLQSFPDEFIIGMRGRRAILGDDRSSDAEHWDNVYKKDIHILLTIESKTQENLEIRYNEIYNLLNDGVRILNGHGSENKEIFYQEASALTDSQGSPTAKEHFGYTDGISNPFFKGMTEEMGNVLGGGKKINYGKPELNSTWAPLETGEFILGYQDEANEYPVAPTPPNLAKNSSFLVFSKFHENVGDFNYYLNEYGKKFPGGVEELAAKFVGRWRNGAPITKFPDKKSADEIAEKREKALLALSLASTPEKVIEARSYFKEVNKEFIAFDYEDDLKGSRCPVGAHTRRANPRGSLAFGNKDAFETPTSLDNRRRMIRRGLPYGTVNDPNSNKGEHGVIIMTIVASIKRQFEFVFQQWLNYGNDFKLANDKDPIVGNHEESEYEGQKIHSGRMVVQGDDKIAPYFLSKIPRFIETKGGEYFFLPSISAINLISKGIVDPT